MLAAILQQLPYQYAFLKNLVDKESYGTHVTLLCFFSIIQGVLPFRKHFQKVSDIVYVPLLLFLFWTYHCLISFHNLCLELQGCHDGNISIPVHYRTRSSAVRTNVEILHPIHFSCYCSRIIDACIFSITLSYSVEVYHAERVLSCVIGQIKQTFDISQLTRAVLDGLHMNLTLLLTKAFVLFFPIPYSQNCPKAFVFMCLDFPFYLCCENPTNYLYSLTGKVMLLFYIGFVLTWLVFICILELSSLHIMDPRYLKVFISSIILPFIFVLVGLFFAAIITFCFFFCDNFHSIRS